MSSFLWINVPQHCICAFFIIPGGKLGVLIYWSVSNKLNKKNHQQIQREIIWGMISSGMFWKCQEGCLEFTWYVLSKYHNWYPWVFCFSKILHTLGVFCFLMIIVIWWSSSIIWHYDDLIVSWWRESCLISIHTIYCLYGKNIIFIGHLGCYVTEFTIWSVSPMNCCMDIRMYNVH